MTALVLHREAAAETMLSLLSPLEFGCKIVAENEFGMRVTGWVIKEFTEGIFKGYVYCWRPRWSGPSFIPRKYVEAAKSQKGL